MVLVVDMVMVVGMVVVVGNGCEQCHGTAMVRVVMGVVMERHGVWSYSLMA